MSSTPRDPYAAGTSAGDTSEFDASATLGGGVYSTTDRTTGMPTSTGTYTGSSGSSGTGDVGQDVSNMADQAKQAASQAKQQVTEQATARVDDQKHRVASQLSSLAMSLDEVSSTLRTQNPTMAQFADTAIDRLNEWSTMIEQKDVGELFGDLERFARRNPALFVGGAFALGLLGARFLKSSAPAGTWATQYRDTRAYNTDYTTGGRYPSYGAGIERQDYTGYSTASARTTGDTTGYGTTYGSGRPSETPYTTDSATRGYGTSGERTSHSPYTGETITTTETE
jgi:hypothetical protein